MDMPIKDYGLVGALMIGMFGMVAWILRSWASWMMKKIDEKNHFAEKMVEHVTAMSQMVQSQEKLTAAIERLIHCIERKLEK